jgi:hypothetical protein
MTKSMKKKTPMKKKAPMKKGLSAKQKSQIDKNKNGKIDGGDFAILRNQKKKKKGKK